MNNYFASVFLKETNIDIRPTITDRIYNSPIDSLTVIEDLVRKAIARINPNKSPGYDNIHPKFLTETVNTIKGPLTIVFNQSIQEEKHPAACEKQMYAQY